MARAGAEARDAVCSHAPCHGGAGGACPAGGGEGACTGEELPVAVAIRECLLHRCCSDAAQRRAALHHSPPSLRPR